MTGSVAAEVEAAPGADADRRAAGARGGRRRGAAPGRGRPTQLAAGLGAGRPGADARAGRDRARVAAASSSRRTATATSSGVAGPSPRACPPSRSGRTAPAFPRVGAASSVREIVLDPVTTHAELVRPVGGPRPAGDAPPRAPPWRGCCSSGWRPTTSSPSPATRRAPRSTPIPQASVVVGPVARRRTSSTAGTCWSATVCQAQVPGSPTVVDQLDGAPCLVTRCPGRLERTPGEPDNFYRRFFGATRGPAGHRARAHLAARRRAPVAVRERLQGPRRTAPTPPTCWSPRRPSRWASTSVTSPR